MTETRLSIYNAALSASRVSGRVSDLADRSVEREECDLWYDQVVGVAQEAAFWPCCRAVARLALSNTRDRNEAWTGSNPEPEFTYLHTLPSDYLRAWHFSDYSRFSVSHNSELNRVALSSNNSSPELFYARREDNPAKWTPGLRRAITYSLAANISGSLTGDSAIVRTNFEIANEAILQARVASANTPNMQDDSLPPALLAREGTISQLVQNRYYHQFGDLFNGA